MAIIIRLPQVIAKTGLSRSTIYAKVKAEEFPPPISLSVRAVGWDLSAVEEWIEEKIQNSTMRR